MLDGFNFLNISAFFKVFKFFFAIISFSFQNSGNRNTLAAGLSWPFDVRPLGFASRPFGRFAFFTYFSYLSIYARLPAPVHITDSVLCYKTAQRPAVAALSSFSPDTALFINSSSSSTLRKLSSRFLSSQVTLPCQFAFCRNATRIAKVAVWPLSCSFVGGACASVTGESPKDLFSAKFCGSCVSSSSSSIVTSSSIRVRNCRPPGKAGWYSRPAMGSPSRKSTHQGHPVCVISDLPLHSQITSRLSFGGFIPLVVISISHNSYRTGYISHFFFQKLSVELYKKLFTTLFESYNIIDFKSDLS